MFAVAQKAFYTKLYAVTKNTSNGVTTFLLKVNNAIEKQH